MIMGVDLVGVVEAVGGGSGPYSVGDRVFGQMFRPPLGSSGAYAKSGQQPSYERELVDVSRWASQTVRYTTLTARPSARRKDLGQSGRPNTLHQRRSSTAADV
jgi:NADPH:quinone reductase-like Zn-dependent oxidoreductase